MPRAKKSWSEKLHDAKDLPKVSAIAPHMRQRWGAKLGDTFVIPAPIEVDELIRKVRKGKLVTIDGLRTALARKHRVTIACPITTGIFAWIAAHAAAEREQQGKRPVTPYWRVLKSGGELNPKYPGGVEELQRRLAAEGHRCVHKGRRVLVEDFEADLVALG